MIEFLPLQKKDLEDVSRIMKESFLNPPWNEEWKLEECFKRLSLLSEMKDNRCFVLTSDKGIIGACFGYTLPYQDSLEYHLVEFFLHPDYQHQGLGSVMMERLKKELVTLNVDSILLSTISSCFPFYEKNGFTKHSDHFLLQSALDSL